MAFKELTTSSSVRYPKYSQMNKGDLIVEGRYDGSSEGKFGIQYHFEDAEGKVTLGKAGHLDYFMEQVHVGDRVRIEYDGSEILKKGPFAGKPAHRFKVMVDEAAAPF